MLKKGTRAPAFWLDQVDGEPIALGEVLGQGCHVVLVFLRYLG
jgi:peroxiredoxin